jgi:CheY-like chemotaxis protein
MIPFCQRNTPLILIADDDRFTRLMLRQILENEGNTSNLDEVLHQIQHLNANNVLDDDFSLLQIDFNRNSDSR